MTPRATALREQVEPAPEIEQSPFSQRKRPELGRFLLQVDRQTKRSYATAEAAEAAGMAIKKGHPQLHVAVHDRIECRDALIELPAVSP